jgi:type VI protein secretion system component VasF
MPTRGCTPNAWLEAVKDHVVGLTQTNSVSPLLSNDSNAALWVQVERRRRVMEQVQQELDRHRAERDTARSLRSAFCITADRLIMLNHARWQLEIVRHVVHRLGAPQSEYSVRRKGCF